MREQWKTIKDFGWYEVSTLGNVRRKATSRVLRPAANSKGYMYVTLSRPKQRQISKRLHVLVAKEFIPNPFGLPDVNHKGTKADCRAAQLEWRSKAGHSIDVMKRQQRGEGVNLHKATGRWRASLFSRERRKHLGWFATKADALKARKEALQTLEEKI